MKYKIENLQDITDSREIMQSSPKGFSKYMTYIIIALISVVIIWSLIAHKEVSIRASGIVRPTSNVNKVSSTVAGTITEINIKDGDEVNEGDILFIINGTQYELQKDILNKSIDDKNKNIDLIKKLKESVLEGQNKFDSQGTDEEKEYSKKYELFEKNLKSTSNQSEAYNKEKDELNLEISNLERLKKGIEEGKNYFESGSSMYYQYKDYTLNIKKYDDAIKSCEDNINTIEKGNTNSADAAQQLYILKGDLQSYKSEKDKLKNSTLMSLTQQIQQDRDKASTLQVSSSENTYKEQYISNLDNNISTIQSSLDEININLKTVESQLDACSIKAPKGGIINYYSDVNIGDFLQAGGEIASIIPEGESDFKVDVYINNQSFGNIKENQEVMIELASLPSSEYGYIKSNLNNISVDIKSNKEGSYYTAECPINETCLTNKKGESADIKNGMIAQVRIVSRRVTYFRYFLEKMDVLS